MMKLTFKEYLESKQALKEAADKNPIQLREYNIINYTKIPVGIGKKREYVKTKPDDKLIIEYYERNDVEPLLLSITLIDKKTGDEKRYKTDLSFNKIQKWINKNTTGNDNG